MLCACGGWFNAAEIRPHRGARVGGTVASHSSCCVMPPVARALPLADIHRPIPALPTASSALIMVREVGRLVDSIINDGGGVGEKFAVDDGTIEPCVRSGLERSAGLAVGAQCQGDERRAQKRRQGWWAGRGEEKAGRMFDAASHLSVPPPEGSAMVALVPVQ